MPVDLIEVDGAHSFEPLLPMYRTSIVVFRCASPKPHLIGKRLILQINDCRLVFAMLNVIVISIRFILLILAGQKQVALENAALRQQLAVFKRNVPRPKSEQPRSIILDRPVHDLAGLAICVDIRAAGNCNILASQSVQTLLVEVVAIETTGSSADWRRDSKADPHHGDRQSHMGSTSHTW